MRKAAFYLALATAGATIAVSTDSAFAIENRGPQIHYADLDLTAEGDRERLNFRIRAAARQACGPVANKSVQEIARDRDCQVAARNMAWNSIAATAQSGHIRTAR